MNVTLAVIADCANVSQEGKLNIMGIFDTIHAETFPTLHPEMKLVIQFEADITEAEQTHRIEIQLMDADGRKPFVVNGQVAVGTIMPGTVFKTHSILNIRGATFERPGDFVFNILVNEEVKRQVPLKVMRLEPPSIRSEN
jgi:hypothetical protein